MLPLLKQQAQDVSIIEGPPCLAKMESCAIPVADSNTSACAVSTVHSQKGWLQWSLPSHKLTKGTPHAFGMSDLLAAAVAERQVCSTRLAASPGLHAHSVGLPAQSMYV